MLPYRSKYTKRRIIWDPGYNSSNPYRPQRKRFGIWWNYTSGLYEGTLVHCYPTIKEALEEIESEFK